jgi:hypothetical protein
MQSMTADWSTLPDDCMVLIQSHYRAELHKRIMMRKESKAAYNLVMRELRKVADDDWFAAFYGRLFWPFPSPSLLPTLLDRAVELRRWEESFI